MSCAAGAGEVYDRSLSASHVFFLLSLFSISNEPHFLLPFLVFVLSFFESPESFASLLSVSFSNVLRSHIQQTITTTYNNHHFTSRIILSS